MDKVGDGVQIAPFRNWKGALFFLLNLFLIIQTHSNDLLRLRAQDAWNMQFRISPLNPNLNRHQVAESLRRCVLNRKVETLVFLFEGTASFDPRRVAALKISLNSLKGHVDFSILKKDLGNEIDELAFNGPRYPELLRWSGLIKGPVNEAIEEFSREDLQWWHFPSEEFEAIAYPERLMNYSISDWFKEIQNSYQNKSPGVTSALKCVDELGDKIQTKKIVLLAHSSGVRTAIKFADALYKKYPLLKIPLAFVIDPVEEVQWAVKEVLSQHLDPTRDFFDKGDVAIHTRENRPGLYKPVNVERWLTLYQNRDSFGFGFKKFPFGIHGSPVRGAENIFISMPDNKEIKAHGTICYHPETIRYWKREFKRVLEEPQSGEFLNLEHNQFLWSQLR